MEVLAGSTDVTTYFKLRLAADGTAATGLTITDLDLQYVRSGDTPAAKVDATALGAANSAHGDNQAFEVDGTDQPGLYRVDWPDAAFAASAREVILTVKHTSIFTEELRVNLTPVPADTRTWLGTAPLSLSSQRVQADVTAVGGNTTVPTNQIVVYATDFATNYNTTADTWNASVTHWLGTAVATPTTAGVPEVDVTYVGGVAYAAVTGTADSGTTTTMVDAARTEADADYWAGSWIMFTSGTISGQCRLITGFNEGTDTITFAPATTQAVGTNTYEIIPAARMIGISGTINTLDALDTAQDVEHDATQSTLASLVTTVGVAGAGLTAADDAVIAAIAALNNLSSAQAQTAAAAALTAYDPPTNAEMEARTLAAADYFDAATDTVTLAAAYDFAKGTVAMTEAYRATGAAPTPAQAFFEIIAHLGNADIVSTTKTLRKLDKTTQAKAFTLDDDTAPTAIEESA